MMTLIAIFLKDYYDTKNGNMHFEHLQLKLCIFGSTLRCVKNKWFFIYKIRPDNLLQKDQSKN